MERTFGQAEIVAVSISRLPDQQETNRKISGRRVHIEQVISSVKRCRMLKETIRLLKAGLRDMVMEIGGALHNFRVRLTPSWTPMV